MYNRSAVIGGGRIRPHGALRRPWFVVGFGVVVVTMALLAVTG